MRMQAIICWIIIGLAALGLVTSFYDGSFWMNLIVPFLVFGVVWLLYRYPTRGYRTTLRKTPKVKPSSRTMEKVSASRSKPSSKRKSYPFQVIDGHKGKRDSDDQLPKYH
ncbi:hypothetical protein PASE110613_02005 [Paenibacillus sediminis]|uniref:DUF2207 domain-containing protein n=1 Tax=Paenibacillus sediminis TaxID=664909 RepID=A0ABS4GZF2_9BACL|nr:hypothetical protein [Paenibacillus sediminis]MBP1935640.1 hypothetical protein [Paenibacillus sediminis]